MALKICVFVGSRANYSSIKSVMRAVDKHPDLELQLVIGASALLDRFGKVEDLIRKDGFLPNYTFHNIVEGENPVTMAKSTGLGTIEMSMALHNLNPDYLVIVGDRFEMMAVYHCGSLYEYQDCAHHGWGSDWNYRREHSSCDYKIFPCAFPG